MTLGFGRVRQPRAENLGIVRRTEQVFGLLAQFSLVDKTVLDVACGYGLQTSRIAWVAKRSIGIDINRNVLIQARQITHDLGVGAEFLNARAECLPLCDSSVDVVLILEALEHVQSPDSVLQEAKRVLGSQGYLVVSVPNKLYPLEIHYVRIGKSVIRGFYGQLPFLSWAPRFVRRRFATARVYTRKEITEIIEANGFVVCQVQYAIFPRLDSLGSKRLTEFCDRFFTHLENNHFLNRFAMSIFVLAQKS